MVVVRQHEAVIKYLTDVSRNAVSKSCISE